MKTRILSIALAILAAGLFASSCDKADFLEGSSWAYTADSGDGLIITFSSKETCALKEFYADGVAIPFAYGEYYGKGKIIAIDWKDSNGKDKWKMTGTIDGDVMTINWDTNDPDNIFKFKKKK